MQRRSVLRRQLFELLAAEQLAEALSRRTSTGHCALSIASQPDLDFLANHYRFTPDAPLT